MKQVLLLLLLAAAAFAPASGQVSCDAFPIDIEVSNDLGSCGAIVSFGPILVFDDCEGEVTIIQTGGLESGDFFPVGLTLNEYTLFNDCGDITDCSFPVIVNDVEPPYIDIYPSDITVTCPGDIPPPEEPAVSDNCGIDFVDYNTSIEDEFCALFQYTEVRTWQFYDITGNASDIVEQRVTVFDNIAPTLTLPPDLTISCEESTDPVNTGFATAVDNCPLNSASAFIADEFFDEGDCTGEAVLTRVWRAEDLCGFNFTEEYQYITIVDNTPPYIACPGDVTISCGDDTSPDFTGEAFAEDACSFTTIGPGDDYIPGCGESYDIVRTWYAEDECGNEATCVQNISVADDEPPVFTRECPIDITLSCYDSTDPFPPSVFDDCGDVASLTNSDFISAGPCPASYSLTRTWTAVDECGNSSICTEFISVSDDFAPEIYCKDITVELDETGYAVVDAELVDDGTFDYCSDFTLELDPYVFGCPDIGSNMVQLTAIDECGNSDNCTAYIEVVDVLPPVARCKDITVQLDADGMASITASDIDDGSSDNCGGVDISLTADAIGFGCANVGPNTVTLFVSDDRGLTSSCDAEVTVEDNVPPVALCRDITVTLTLDCDYTIDPLEVDDGSYDACGIAGYSVEPNYLTTAEVGDNTVTLTVTDNNGNSDDCTATVTLLRRPTTLSNLGVFEGQYSDYPVLQAQLIDDLSGLPIAGKTIEFTLGPITATGVTDASGIATVSFRLGYPLPPTVLGYDYTIEAVFPDDDPCWLGASDSDPFTVLQEDARLTYTGKNFASTVSAATGNAVVVLAATVCDITNTADAAGDSDPGDISNATVTFVDRDNGNAPISPPLEVVPLPGDTTKGTVSFVWMTDIGLSECETFNIGIVVDNYYTRDDPADDQEIIVCRPDDQFITGGGYIILEDSWGSLPGDDGTHCNFGVHANFQGREDRIGGHVNIIYRRMEADGEHRIQISSIKVASLGIDADEKAAEICGSGRVTDVTTGEVLYPAGTFIIRADDNGNPGGGNDEIRFAFYAPDGELVFSSKWAGTYTDMSVLEGGNIVFHQQLNASNRVLTAPESQTGTERQITAEVYPNPFSREANIRFTLDRPGYTFVEVISLSGEIVAGEELGRLDAGISHQWTFEAPDLLNSGTYLYRIISDSGHANGVLLFVK